MLSQTARAAGVAAGLLTECASNAGGSRSHPLLRQFRRRTVPAPPCPGNGVAATAPAGSDGGQRRAGGCSRPRTPWQGVSGRARRATSGFIARGASKPEPVAGRTSSSGLVPVVESNAERAARVRRRLPDRSRQTSRMRIWPPASRRRLPDSSRQASRILKLFPPLTVPAGFVSGGEAGSGRPAQLRQSVAGFARSGRGRSGMRARTCDSES